MNAGGLQVRAMLAVDLEPVLALAEGLLEAPHWTEATWRAVLDPRCSPRRLALVAAEPEAGTVLGFLVASLLPPQAELEAIAVAATAQRQGVGRRLFAVLAAELRSADVEDVWLEVRASNLAAQSFYRSLGFAETGRRLGYYADPIEDAILMGLSLAEMRK